MTYQALYRVFRPQTFSDMSGQKAITQTLKNAIKTGNTSHAYLFSGPRGTGKTSAAKIFAKAINCPNQVDGDPCNQCPICQQVNQGSLGDVIEIDAASNNGVEEIRDIREKANYAPTQADFKVYIIDEVHMLSMGAFNALLKTLEEPPTNVVFILATTEPHKIPLTIISRTQRFDFKRISNQDIIDRMQYILKDRQVDYEDSSLKIIANAAEGGMRDALSMLDQALSYGGDTLTSEDALQITGSITQSLLIDYLSRVLESDTQGALKVLGEILADGKDASRFVEDTILFLRDLVLYQANPGDLEYLKIGQVNEDFEKIAQAFPSDLAFKLIDILNQTQLDLKASNHADVYLEIATVKMSQKREQAASLDSGESLDQGKLSQELNYLRKKVQDLESAMDQSQNQSTPTPPAQTRRKSKVAGGRFKVNIKAVQNVLENATSSDRDQVLDLWGDLIHSLDDSHRGIMRNSKPVAASSKALVVTFEYDILCEKAEADELLQKAIGDFLNQTIGHQPRLVCVPEDQWTKIRSDYIKEYKARKKEQLTEGSNQEPSQDQAAEEDESDQLVETAFKVFGKENVEVKE